MTLQRPPGGEQLVAAYLRQCRLSYERERLVDSRRPDFSVDHLEGTFVMEVYDPYIPFNEHYSGPVARQDFPRAFADRKREQILAVARAGLPYVGVIGPGQAQREVDVFALAQTMFGDAGVTLPVGPDVVPQDARESARFGFFSSDASRVTPDLNNEVSAMAVVRTFNPTQRVLDAALDARLPATPPASVMNEEFESFLAARFKIAERIASELVHARTYLPEARVSQLIVVHNPWAIRPLPYDRLAGPYDFQIGPWPRGDRLTFEVVSHGRFAGPFRW